MTTGLKQKETSQICPRSLWDFNLYLYERKHVLWLRWVGGWSSVIRNSPSRPLPLVHRLDNRKSSLKDYLYRVFTLVQLNLSHLDHIFYSRLKNPTCSSIGVEGPEFVSDLYVVCLLDGSDERVQEMYWKLPSDHLFRRIGELNT